MRCSLARGAPRVKGSPLDHPRRRHGSVLAQWKGRFTLRSTPTLPVRVAPDEERARGRQPGVDRRRHRARLYPLRLHGVPGRPESSGRSAGSPRLGPRRLISVWTCWGGRTGPAPGSQLAGGCPPVRLMLRVQRSLDGWTQEPFVGARPLQVLQTPQPVPANATASRMTPVPPLCRISLTSWAEKPDPPDITELRTRLANSAASPQNDRFELVPTIAKTRWLPRSEALSVAGRRWPSQPDPLRSNVWRPTAPGRNVRPTDHLCVGSRRGEGAHDLCGVVVLRIEA